MYGEQEFRKMLNSKYFNDTMFGKTLHFISTRKEVSFGYVTIFTCIHLYFMVIVECDNISVFRGANEGPAQCTIDWSFYTKGADELVWQDEYGFLTNMALV